jgi:hypothetical protein
MPHRIWLSRGFAGAKAKQPAAGSFKFGAYVDRSRQNAEDHHHADNPICRARLDLVFRLLGPAARAGAGACPAQLDRPLIPRLLGICRPAGTGPSDRRDCVKSERNLNLPLNRNPYHGARNDAESGDVVNRRNGPALDQQGFSTEEIVWATGIWSVILCLSPVILFYVLIGA